MKTEELNNLSQDKDAATQTDNKPPEFNSFSLINNNYPSSEYVVNTDEPVINSAKHVVDSSYDVCGSLNNSDNTTHWKVPSSNQFDKFAKLYKLSVPSQVKSREDFKKRLPSKSNDPIGEKKTVSTQSESNRIDHAAQTDITLCYLDEG